MPFRLLVASLSLAAGLFSTPLFVSGQGMDVVRFHQGDAPHDRHGRAVAILDDFTGDGSPEYAVASPRFGIVEIRSGVDGALLDEFVGPAIEDDFGISIARIADQNGDGSADLAIGAWLYDGVLGRDTGAVFIYSASTGAVIGVIEGDQESEELGTVVADAGDVDGDGVGDLLIGAPGYTSVTAEFAGRVVVYSIATGSILWQVEGSNANQHFGREVTTAGDLDGDGMAEIAIGDPSAALGEGRIAIHAGVDGSLLRTVAPPLPGERAFGTRLVNLGDRDGDTLDELGCTSRTATQTVGSVIEGVDGTFLTRYVAPISGGFTVQALASAPDVDGDGVGDVLVHGAGDARYCSGDADVTLDQWSMEALGLGRDVPRTAGFADFDGDGHPEHLLGYDYLRGATESRTGAAAIIERRAPDFIRADVNQDGAHDLSDALRVLDYLFQSVDVPCLAAADVGDDTVVDITDAVLLLGFLFIPGSPPPSAPFPMCGPDPTDPLPCSTIACPSAAPIAAVSVPATATLPPLPVSPVTFFGAGYGMETVVWCVDTSASLGWGGEIASVQAELTAAVNSLEQWQLFDIVAFNTTVSRFANETIHGSDDNAQAAASWIDGLTATGTSCMQTALLNSVAIANQSLRRDRGIILLSDGLPTCRGTDQSIALLAALQESNYQELPVHVILWASDPDAISVMQLIAAQNGGTFTLVQ